MILGVDTGGTFTDFVLLSDTPEGGKLRTHKVLSTPDAPERAILQGIAEMGLEDQVKAGRLRIIHGSTVATNAALEGKGVRTAFIGNRGFADLLSIGRQTRARLYALECAPPAPPVPPELCLECAGRLDAAGRVLEEPAPEDLESLAGTLAALAPRAVAINLLFSFLDERHERELADYLERRLPGAPFITRSSFVLPEYREYERGIATWLNASLGPLVQAYLLRLRESTAPSPLAVMQSSGGTIDAGQAARRAVNLLLSGPAGGLAAAAFLASSLDEARLMTFDMGGTSTDVALIEGGEIRLGTEGRIGPYPVAVPMVDMHTIGAGGGSIAAVDEGGLLQVGPASAGASPGPACYGRGGTAATVTDANLVLGRLPADSAMAGSLRLDAEAARRAVGELAARLGLTPEACAEGIIALADEHMARALRVISVERGHDPCAFRLCCFGGAGGLHICRLAEALGMRRGMVPVHAGVLSAMGMFLAPVERQLSRTHRRLLQDLEAGAVETIARELRAGGLEELGREGIGAAEVEAQLSMDLRYRGQSATLNLPWRGDAAGMAADFHRLHERRYGHSLPAPVELVNVRLALRAPAAAHSLAPLPESAPGTPHARAAVHGCGAAVPLYRRESLAPGQILEGPALVVETTSTTLIEAGWSAEVDRYGNLMLERGEQSSRAVNGHPSAALL